MTSGFVKRIHERGFFFIQPTEGGPEIFGHVNRLQFPPDELKVGDRLEFETELGPKGLRASFIQRAENAQH